MSEYDRICHMEPTTVVAFFLFYVFVYRNTKEGREVAPMMAYEIISIFIGILALLMSFGSLILALLAFLDKRNKRK